MDNAARRLHYYNAFLDDLTRGLFPHDLVLIGAPSGVGKTDLAIQISSANVSVKAPVALFALEAEPREVERRIKFAMLSKWLFAAARDAVNNNGPLIDTSIISYPDWMAGNMDRLPGIHALEDRADAVFLRKYGLLHTFYRDAAFGYDELRQSIEGVNRKVSLIVIDHLHYIDIDDENENRGLSDTMKMLRDMSIAYGKPIILIAHLRKQGAALKRIAAEKDDFHGSSNIVKQVTHAVILDRAYDIEPPGNKWWLSPTYCTVAKDRRGGDTGYTALTYYNKQLRSYQDGYTLGRLTSNNTKWEELQPERVPAWAKRHASQQAIAAIKEAA